MGAVLGAAVIALGEAIWFVSHPRSAFPVPPSTGVLCPLQACLQFSTWMLLGLDWAELGGVPSLALWQAAEL